MPKLAPFSVTLGAQGETQLLMASRAAQPNNTKTCTDERYKNARTKDESLKRTRNLENYVKLILREVGLGVDEAYDSSRVDELP